MRRFFEGLCQLLLRVFFRRIDVIGGERVPAEGPVIFCLNHPNGLVDPLFILCLARRRVAFLAKAPLFSMPLVKHFVRAFECLPVYRQQDGGDRSGNRRTMEAARALLSRGGALALFPEGISHDEPELQPLRTGAARIALAAQAMMADDQQLHIVPAGLFYPGRGQFRSEAAMVYGEPLRVPRTQLSDVAEPPAEAVRALTRELEAALRERTVNAERAELVQLAASAAGLLRGAAGEETATAGEQMQLMQRLLEGYRRLSVREPEAVAGMLERLRRHERDLAYAGLSPNHPRRLAAPTVARYVWRSVLALVAAAPLAALGAAVNYPAYRAVGAIARRVSKGDEDIVATAKLLGGLLLFPLGWALASVAAGAALGGHLMPGWAWGLGHLALAPAAAWAALWSAERLEVLGTGARQLMLMLARRDVHAALVAERTAIAAALRELAERIPED